MSSGSKGGRPATGWVKWRKGQFYTQITLATGERSPFIALDPGIPQHDRARAKACAKVVSDEARASGMVPDAVVETVEEYAKRWAADRRTSGLGCVDGDIDTLTRHVFPIIGKQDVRTIGRDDLKKLVAELDAKARRGSSIDAVTGKRRPFGWKTASNVWSVVRALMRDACRSKDVALCVRDDNPARDVAGPDVGAKKAKAYLWPSEFLQLVSCERVPLRWRRLFAVAVYSYARAGELAALRWEDVDLDHGTLHIHRSNDRVRRREGSTKSGAARRPPIEPALTPLLRALFIEAGGKGLVLSMPSIGSQSRKLRTYLRRAGVTRADLFASDATRKAITFHDLRASGITWCAVRGDEPLKIQQRAGHEDFDTTAIYVREAENLAAGFGDVFPPLPPCLLGPSEVSHEVSRFALAEDPNTAKLLESVVELTGIESGDENAKRTEKQGTSSLHSPNAVFETSGVRDGSRTAPRRFAPECAELERGILEAVTAGAFDVARVLAAQLEDRRRSAQPNNVVAFRKAVQS